MFIRSNIRKLPVTSAHPHIRILPPAKTARLYFSRIGMYGASSTPQAKIR